MTTQNSQPILQCVLSNGAHPEYGQAMVPFPIPAGDYGRTLELLAGMGLGDPLNRDCRVDELHSGFPILKRLEKVGANLDELDYLARRLDSFTEREAAQFQGMAVRLGIFDMTDFINLTFCCQQATVITDFSDLEQIGRDHYMNLHGGCASMEELERLDARRTALDLILNDQRRAFSDAYVNDELAQCGLWAEVSLHGPLGALDRVDVEELRGTPCILISSREIP